MNMAGLLADTLLSSVISFSLATLAQNGQADYGIFALFLWSALAFAVVARRLSSIPAQGAALAGATILVLAIALATNGAFVMILCLLGWSVFMIRQYREISDPLLDSTQWRRLFIDLPIALVLLVLNAMANSDVQALAASIVALSFAARVLALRTSEIAYARQNGVSFIASLLRSQSALIVIAAMVLLFLITFYQDILRLILDILTPFLWLVAYLLQLIFSHLKQRKPVGSSPKGGIPKHPQQKLVPNTHPLLNEKDFAWLPYALAIAACLLLIYAIWRLRNKTQQAPQGSDNTIITRSRIAPSIKAPPAPTPLRQVFLNFVAYNQKKQALLLHKGATAAGLARQASLQLSEGEQGRTESLDLLVNLYEAERYGEQITPAQRTEQVSERLRRDDWLDGSER